MNKIVIKEESLLEEWDNQMKSVKQCVDLNSELVILRRILTCAEQVPNFDKVAFARAVENYNKQVENLVEIWDDTWISIANLMWDMMEESIGNRSKRDDYAEMQLAAFDAYDDMVMAQPFPV
jgi:hypothetical protein